MNAIGKLAGRDAQWALVDVLYFDSTTHAFARGDLEINGSRIERILAPHTSRRAATVAAHDIVCIPGLIDPDTGGRPGEDRRQSARLAQCGITTAGAFHPGTSAFDESGEPDAIRRLFYVELGETRGVPSMGVDARSLREFEHRAAARASDMRVLLPAIVPCETWSAASLSAVAALAERMGRKLCVRLCNTKAAADQYRETRYFTELGLLSYMSLLSSHTTVFELSQVSRRDASVLRGSSAGLVCGSAAISEAPGEPLWAALALKDRAVGLAIHEDILADQNRYASVLIASMTFMHRSDTVSASCDALVDALTCSAADALGIADIGAIGPGMKADLCLFERPSDFHAGGDSLHLIKLLVSRKPRHVLVDGLPVVIDGAVQMTLAHA